MFSQAKISRHPQRIVTIKEREQMKWQIPTKPESWEWMTLDSLSLFQVLLMTMCFDESLSTLPSHGNWLASGYSRPWISYLCPPLSTWYPQHFVLYLLLFLVTLCPDWCEMCLYSMLVPWMSITVSTWCWKSISPPLFFGYSRARLFSFYFLWYCLVLLSTPIP